MKFLNTLLVVAVSAASIGGGNGKLTCQARQTLS
jgi:hypothetical protein